MKNKKVLVVGGSFGIGLTVAKQAQGHGAYVIIASRNTTERKKELLQELPEESIDLYDLDITSSSAQNDLFAQISEIDHLVITVKPEISSAPFQETSVQEAKEAFETKLWGAYQLIQAAQPFIAENGSIILTSGIAGEKIFRGASTIALINSATETLGRSLAVELAPVRVNVVSPGFVKPKPQALQNMANNFPVPRLASPDEIASAYLRLMENQYVTGTVTVVDGGATLI
ncbi:NAD(P)-dependent dehydrogenase, short-chain alcohol dehydrogenase family [Fodinibius roseus]|uniref:NAD(P)-dependent dehydrogenase, short-chain alcohol dehydrogenase family n=1 Tax=Fodinibius roseus TaxID=1194090 RepID=A0A1M4YYT9_9BACT|nr:SDR family oxidoreductase [Fodinibius roseus]SHF10984.1 NAD(P)-dependent dehydrogenase, short-chain alcohol dehydrogenase family [Fodinibius roseus]